MSDPDVFLSHAEATIYDLRKMLEKIIIAHETGRYEPLQAAIEATIARLAEMDMPSPTVSQLEAALAKMEESK